jgi:GDPmannose 4,6-dehydratase
MFGEVVEIPQKETTPFNPVSDYGESKRNAFNKTIFYRKRGIFAVNGILFNHESPRRGENFVTRKITKGLADIIAGKQEKIQLGNLDAKRDWGYAPEYVEAMWLMMQHSVPDDYVIATGETHSVREFLEEACKYAGIEIESNQQEGVKEKYFNKRTGKVIVEIDSEQFRPKEVNLLVGDASKAKRILGWEPKVKFKELVKIMMEADLQAIRK